MSSPLWMFTSQSSGVGLRGFDPNYHPLDVQVEWWLGPKGHCRGLDGELLVSGVGIHLAAGLKRDAVKTATGWDKHDFMDIDAWDRLVSDADVHAPLRPLADPSVYMRAQMAITGYGCDVIWYVGQCNRLEHRLGKLTTSALESHVRRWVTYIPLGATVVIDDVTDATPDSFAWRVVQILRSIGYKVGTEPSAKKGTAWEKDANGVSWITAPLYNSNTSGWKVTPPPHREYVQCYGAQFETEAFVRRVLRDGATPMLGSGWYANPANKELAASIIAQGSK
jgi:hypothetical protein